MKAILVIDVPMLYDGRHLCNECPIWNDEHWVCQYDFNMEAKGCPLKPLPQRKVPKFGEAFPQSMALIDRWKGYDECLDDILGETE